MIKCTNTRCVFLSLALIVVVNSHVARANSVGGSNMFSLGSGAAIQPDYEGGKGTRGGPMPIINARWKRFHVDDGFRVDLFGNAGGEVSIGAAYDFGRRDSGGEWLGAAGSNYLRGLGTIEGAPTIDAKVTKVMGLSQFGVLQATGKVTHWVGNHDFTTAEGGVLFDIPISERLTVETSASAVWANHSYMQSFFGVNAKQALASHFPIFAVHHGIKNLTESIQASYIVRPKWTVVAKVSDSQLLGDAQRSPVVQRRSGVTGSLLLMYRVR